MKAGFNNKREVIAMVVLLLVAAFTASKFLLSGSAAAKPASAAGPAKASAKNASTPAPAARKVGRLRPRTGNQKTQTVASLDPTLRFDWLKSSEEREYRGGKRNIFTSFSEAVDIPKPDKDVRVTPPNPGPVVPAVIPPPPIDLKFFGFASKPGEAKKVFLSQREDVFIASEGEIVNKRYRIVKIGTTSIEVEDVLNNNKQTIPLSTG